MATVPSDVEIDYPTSDGRPMAETDLHRKLMIEVIQTLEDHFADQASVYVSGNLMVYYDQGKPRRFRSPDAFVAFGVPKHDRLTYKVWEEGKAPDWVLEITSKTTEAEDREEKLAVYRDIWKVKEYFLFDPLEEWLEPSMQAFRLVNGDYVSIEPDRGAFRSEILDLILAREGYHLVFRDPHTATTILRRDAEAIRQAQMATELAEAKAAHAEADLRDAQEAIAFAERERDAAQAEIESLKRELQQLRQPPAKAEGQG